MKIIIAEPYQKNNILHTIANQQEGIVTDVQVLSLSTAMNEDRDDPTAVLLQLKETLSQQQNSFPIYRDMLKYPAFLKEVLSFGRECLLWGIQKTDLPADNDNEKELQKILAAVFSLNLAEKKIYANHASIMAELTEQDITLWPAFYNQEYQYEIFQQLAKKFPVTKVPQTPKQFLRYGLNTRQEIEAVAQQICRTNQPCNVILTNYSVQYPVLKQVFERYGIPFSCISEETTLHIPHIFAALCTFGWKKDKASFLQTLKLNAYVSCCPLYLIDYLDQRMTDVSLPKQIAAVVQQSPFVKEAAAYQQLDDAVTDYMTKIQEDYDLLLSSSTPADIFMHAYHVLQKSSYLKEKNELRAGMIIRNTLQASLPILTETEVPFLIETIDAMHSSASINLTDFCMVTDLHHPVCTRQISYVLGCSGRNYPGFPAMRGLFDESYVARTKKYPTLTVRHTSYMEQLSWIANSASKELYYSYAANDYAGHEIELALEVESLFPPKSAMKWQLDVLRQKPPLDHVLTPETAKVLFTKDNVISGSISTIERYFNCPYAYYIQSGLNVRGPQLKANDAASIGSIQHSFLENGVKQYQKTYPKITEKEIYTFLEPYFDTLKITHPNETERLTVTEERMVQGLQTSLLFLADMEANTSFTPAMTEQAFKEEIVDGVLLRGVIDRIDTCNDLIRVLDYKSSSHKLQEKNVKAGQSLQLLSYLIIAQKMTGKKPLGAYYFSLKDAGFAVEAASISHNVVRDVPLSEDLLKERFIKERRLCGWTFDDRSVELDQDNKHIVNGTKLMDYDLAKKCMEEIYAYFQQHLLNGRIPLSPVDGACAFCDYPSICRFAGAYRPLEPLVMKDVSLKQGKETK